MENNFFYTKTINGEEHLKMMSVKDDLLEKDGYSEISYKRFVSTFSEAKRNRNLKIK